MDAHRISKVRVMRGENGTIQAVDTAEISGDGVSSDTPSDACQPDASKEAPE